MFFISFLIKFVVTVLQAVLEIYFWLLIIRVILSWVQPDSYHPLVQMIYRITEPVLAPVRRVIPPIGGLDWSVLIVTILIKLVQTELLPQLAMMAYSITR